MNILNNTFNLFFFLFSLSLITSMAGLSGTTIALGFIAIVTLATSKSRGFFNSVKELRFDGEKFVGFFVLTVILSILMNGYELQQGLMILKELRWVLIFIALVYLFQKYLTRSFYIRCLNIVVVCSFLLAIYAIEQHLFGKDLLRENFKFDHFGKQFRASGFFSIALTFSYVLGSLGMLLTFLSYHNKEKKYFYLSGAVACFICVFCSGTRGAWLASVFTLLITFLFINKKVFLKCLVGVILVFSILMIDANFRKRINTLVDIQSSGSNISRMNILEAYKEMYKDNPIFGVGYEQNKKYLPAYFEKLKINERLVSHAHNDYMQIAVGTGIIGLVAYLAMLLFFLKKNFSLIKLSQNDSFLKGLAFGAFAVQIYIYAGGLTQVNFTDSVVKHTLLYYWAILYFIERELRKAGQTQNG